MYFRRVSVIGDMLFAFLELIFQALFGLGLEKVEHFTNNPLRRNGVLMFFMWGIIGMILGALSSVLLPAFLPHYERQNEINLLVIPIAVAGILSQVGKHRDAQGIVRVSLDFFVNAWVFTFTMMLTRTIGIIGS